MSWAEFWGLVDDIPTILRREQALQLDIAQYHASLTAGEEASHLRDTLERTIRDGAKWEGDDLRPPDVVAAEALEEKKNRFRSARNQAN